MGVVVHRSGYPCTRVDVHMCVRGSLSWKVSDTFWDYLSGLGNNRPPESETMAITRPWANFSSLSFTGSLAKKKKYRLSQVISETLPHVTVPWFSASVGDKGQVCILMIMDNREWVKPFSPLWRCSSLSELLLLDFLHPHGIWINGSG